VGDGVGVGAMGNGHLLAGDQRAGDGRAQQVVVLVDRPGLEHLEAELLGELLAEVLDDDLIGAAGLGLLHQPGQLVALAEIGGEGHELHARVSLLQPRQDDRGVKAAGIGEHDLSGVGHGFSSLKPRGNAKCKMQNEK